MLVNAMLRRRRKMTGLIASLMVMVMLSMAQAATIQVNTVIDDLEENGNCSLREAIFAANTDHAIDGCFAGAGVDIIDIPAGVYVLTQGRLDITDVVTLDGEDDLTTFIDGQHITQILAVDVRRAGTTRVRNLTLYRGMNYPGGPFGAAVYHIRGKLAIDFVTIAESIGNAIYSERSSKGVRDRLVLKDSFVYNNQDYAGSALYREQGWVNVFRSLITQNDTIPEYNGANEQAAGLTLSKGRIEYHDAVIDENYNTTHEPVERNCQLGLPTAPFVGVTIVQLGENTLGEGCLP
jgi:CSLREA domain-containing protein